MTLPRPRPLRDRPPLPDRLAGTAGLLVATDFDGTLAPIHEDPQAPLASAENRRALRRLAAHPATVVAVISGRALADLRPRVGVEDIVYVGNHGLEIDRGGPPQAHPEARERASLVREACRAVEEATTPGVRVEDKGLTATIHHREAEEATRRRVRRLLEDHVQATGDELRLSTGKANVELRPAVDWDKGSALRELADDAPPGWATVYLGDDDTDEDAFRALDEGLGIHVGRRSDTAAGYRIEDQAEVAGFLNALASEIHGEATWSANGAPRRPSAREATP